jgi:transcriptional regulator with XRE-family HTH domain
LVITRLNIRQARINAALSQRDLAKLLGVSSVAVFKWERGESFPSADKLPSLASALGVPIDELYSRDSPPTG